MKIFLRTVWVLVVAGLLPSSAQSADDFPASTDAMARHIDRLLAARWKAEGVQPAAVSSDAEFLRRIYLDLTGVVPTVSQARAFLDSEDPDKRTRLIDQLLESPGFATHMANTWRNRLLPNELDIAQQQNVAGLQNWLREQFVNNLRYDNLVAEFLVATGTGQRGPGVFYTALELKPEKLAANTARIFLGLQIQCAECHDHPSDRWTRKDFWGYAAFFAQLQGPTGRPTPNQAMQIVDLPRGEVTLPDSDEVVAPRYPGGGAPRAEDGGTRRLQLSIWMASRDNPYLARAAVNWGWAHLFGRGIVEPLDDLSDKNPPSHPQVLADLTRYFVRQGFDVRELFRTLANTNAYQLSSSPAAGKLQPPELFAQMAIKSLTPEQLYDSLNRTLARQPTMNVGFNLGQPRLFDPRRQQFIRRMQTQTRNPTEYEAGLPQALQLMNGPTIGEATDPERSALLVSLEAPFFKDEQRLDVLFLATLSRRPTAKERDNFLAYIRRGGAAGNRRKAAGDVLWALLNSAEFALNH